MQNTSESPESPATPSDIPLNIDFPPIMPFDQFKAEVDSLMVDILLHPQGEQLLSEFAQMLREIGIPIEEPVDMHDHSSEGDLKTSPQADTNGSLTESGQMATTSTSTDVVHKQVQMKAFDDPVAGDSS